MTTKPTSQRLPGAKLFDTVRAIRRQVCDLGFVKTPRASRIVRLLAPLLVSGSLSLSAQTNDPGTPPATNVVAASPVEPEHKPAPASGKLDYSSFKIVTERNIFNGNRSGQRLTSTRSSTQQRSVRVESFTLVGTLLSEEKAPMAFFDGSSSELRKALKAGGNIAGFSVKEILHTGVRLAEGTNTLEVPVGSGMRREDEGLWKFFTGGNYASAAGSVTPASSSSDEARSSNGGRSSGRDRGGRDSGRDNNEASPAASSSGGASAAPADAAEILKRLMEKREKE